MGTRFRFISIVSALALTVSATLAGVETKIAPSLRAAARGGTAKRSVLVITSSRVSLLGAQDAVGAVPNGIPRAIRLGLTPAEMRKMADSPQVIAVVPDEPPVRPPLHGPQLRAELAPFLAGAVPLPNTWYATDIVGARAAWDLGYTGKGVKVAVLDDGIDFGHPDLQGTQARVEDPNSPYFGWPIVFDSHSMSLYASTGKTTSTFYVSTKSTVTEANPIVGTTRWKLPGASKSGVYHHGAHPSYWLMWMPRWGVAVRVLVADEHEPGLYDTVYVDLDKDFDFTDEKPCRRGDEAAWHDTNGDGIADLSGGMVYFIADGVHPIPASDWLYNLPPPENGALVCFAGAFGKYDGHGTLCASAIAAQGVIGRGEPPYRADGGGIVRGTAPDAKLISIGNVYNTAASMYDAVLFAALGYDGKPNTGDEADIASMSFGYSTVDNDGWDYLARYIAYVNATQAPRTTFVGATGNGGPGYGTVTSPASSPTVISVGASTLYGSVPVFDDIASVEQITHGDIQPWSNRGPSALGICEPDVVAVGAWATGDVPIMGDGQAAWGVWGGTSLSTPMACGVLANACEAFEMSHGTKPTYEQARVLLMAGADDLGYPVLEQGAGQVDAVRSVRVALGEQFQVTPASWQVGQTAAGFPGTVEPFQRVRTSFTVTNQSARMIKLQVVPETLVKTAEKQLTVEAVNAQETEGMSGPSYLIDLMGLIPNSTDLLRIRAAIPFEQTSLNGPSDQSPRLINAFALIAYDWTDLNRNGLVWRDDTQPNGVVNEGELDKQELSRFTYNAAAADCLEISVTDPLRRRHDGLYLGLQHYARSEDIPVTSIKLTLEFYKRRQWDQVNVAPQRITLVPGRERTFTATYASSLPRKPGVYSGALHVSADDGAEQIIPVTACVTNTPTDPTLSLLGPDGFDAPYDNGFIYGAYDWAWRPESGDWRTYFYTPPRDVGPNARLLANVNWKTYPTDIDFLLFGPDRQDFFSTNLPELFGPHSLVPIGGSRHTNVSGGGVWPFYTNTDEASEWVSAPMTDGLHLGLLHCVLSSGKSSGEPLVLGMGPAVVDPLQFELPAREAASRSLTLTPYLCLWEGVEARAYGFSKPIDLTGVPISREPVDNPPSARFFRDLWLSNAGVLDVRTTSPDPIDIDLYILRDANGNKAFNWNTEIIAISGGVSASEHVRIVLPSDGLYRIAVHGYDVSVTPATFSIKISAIQGADISVTSPAGTVFPGQPARFDLNFGPGEPGSEAVILLGPRGAHSAMDVPVRVLP